MLCYSIYKVVMFMDKRAWAVWTAGQADPAYARLYQQMYALEARFEEVVSRLDDQTQDVIRDYVMHCEAMSWRMLEFACERYEARE